MEKRKKWNQNVIKGANGANCHLKRDDVVELHLMHCSTLRMAALLSNTHAENSQLIRRQLSRWPADVRQKDCEDAAAVQPAHERDNNRRRK